MSYISCYKSCSINVWQQLSLKKLLLVICYFIVLLWHCNSAANTTALSDTKSLKVQLIDTFQLNHESHLQLRLRFNQNIHRPGEIPTAAMLDAISITPDIDCRWFFPNPDTLACDTVLPQEAVYRVDVHTNFNALGQRLTAPAQYEFHAGAWRLELDLPQMRYAKHLEYPVLLFTDNRWSKEQLAKMEWRSPSGTATSLPLELLGLSHDKINVYKVLLTASESGDYQLVLPADLNQHYKADRIIWQGHIYQQPKLFGWYCWQFDENSEKNIAYLPIKPASNNCPPSKLALRFIGDINFFDQKAGGYHQAPLGEQFVSGSNALAATFPSSDGSSYLHLYLAGNSDYTFHFSNLIAKEQDINITTNLAEPLWQLANSSDTKLDPTIIHWPDEAWHQHYNKVNIIDIDGVEEPLLTDEPLLIPRIHTQQSSQRNLLLQWQHLNKVSEFQHWMNAIWQDQPFVSPLYWQNAEQLFPTTSSYQINPQIWQNTQWLNSQDDHKFSQHGAILQPQQIAQSGLYPYRIGDAHRQVQHWLQRPAFNLELFQVDDLFVRLSDWQDQAKPSASIYRVCPGQTSPALLGQTNKQGLLHVPANILQTGASVSPKAPCWIWAQATEGMATFPLPKRKAAKPLHGWFITNQPAYQQGDDVELMAILRQRSPQGLIAPTDVNDLAIELKTYSGKVLQRWSIQSINDNGWYHKTLPASWFPLAGYYNLHLLQGTKQLESTTIKIARFELPLYRLDTTLSEWSAAGEKSQFELTMQSMTGQGLVSDVRIEASWRPEAMHRLPWLQHEYNFSDDGNYPKPDKKSWSLQTDSHGLLKHAIGLPENIDIKQGAPAYKLTLNYETRDMMGEWQGQTKSTLLLNRDHLVGSKVQNQQIMLNAFLIQDSELTAAEGIPVSRIEWREGASADSPLLAECPLGEAAKLPLTCPLPLSLRTAKRTIAYMHLQSGATEQRTVRRFALVESTAKVKRKPKGPSFTAPQTIDSWAPLSIEIHSPKASEAVLLLYTNQIHQVIPLNLVAGTTPLRLPITPAMAPELSLALFTTNAEDGWSGTYHQIKSSVQTYELPLTLELLADKPATFLPPTSQQTVALKSAEDADVALFWLHESLLYLFASTHIERLNPNTLLNHKWNNLAKRYELAELHNLRSYEISSWLSPWLAYQTSQNIAFNMPTISLGDPSHTDRKTSTPRVVDGLKPAPLWLGMHSVKAEQTKQLTITTPQQPGQWHLIAIAAGKTKFTRQQQSFTVKDNWQTMLAVPENHYPTDQAYANLLVFNSSSTPQQGRFRLLLNGQQLQQFSLNLVPGERRQQVITLPLLPTGQQQLTLWQLDEKTNKPYRLLQQQTWQVIPEIVQHKRRIQADTSGVLNLPAATTQVTGSAITMSSLQPDWSALTSVEKQAPASWEVLLSEWWLAERLSHRPPSWANKQALHIWALPFHKAGKYSRYATTNSDTTVTLFSYWLQSQLADPTILPPSSADIIQEWRKKLHSNQVALPEQALLAWWLSSQNALSFTELLSLRSQMGQLSSSSDAVQTLAILLLALNEQLQLTTNTTVAQQAQIQTQQAHWQDELLALGYQDASYSALSPESACWLILAAGSEQPKLQGLKLRLILAQQATGSFGSARSNAICTAALFNNSSSLAQPRQLKLTAGQEAGRWHHTAEKQDWLSLHYIQPLATHRAQYSGISINKSFLKYQDGKWLPAPTVVAGDLVQVVLTLSTPVAREHIKVTDPLLPGMLPLPKRYHRFTDIPDASEASFTSVLQQERTMYWHSSYLPAGETILRYIVQVRLPGHYQHGISRASALYNPLVFGSTDGSNQITIQMPATWH